MIEFYNQEIEFDFIFKKKVSEWINSAVYEHDKKVGELTFVFTNDDKILEVNKKFLNHNYYTDVITFDNSVNDLISGDILISIDTVKDNSIRFKQTFYKELFRVIIHGVLHLLGFGDSNDEEQEIMTQKEDFYLSKEIIRSILSEN